MWMTDRTLHPGQQQSMGVRVDVRIRSQVHSTGGSKRSWMTQNGWLRTCYVRDRQPGAPRELIQVTCPIQNAVSLPQVWSDMICFTHRPVYMARQRDVTLTPGPKVRLVDPPTPPKPRRLRVPRFASEVEVRESPTEPTTSQPVYAEPEPQTPTSPASTETSEYEPVAHMAWDLDRREQVEINLDDSNETDSEVPPDPNTQPSSSRVLPISLHVAPNERTTMGRKHRRAVLEGIDRLNHNDALVKSSIGLKDVPSTEPPTLVITSHPRLSQELQAADGVADVFDVGVGAENLNPDEDSKIWYDVLQDYKNIIIAIEYGQHTDPLRHGKILGEVESHCDMTGSRFLHPEMGGTRISTDPPYQRP